MSSSRQQRSSHPPNKGYPTAKQSSSKPQGSYPFKIPYQTAEPSSSKPKASEPPKVPYPTASEALILVSPDGIMYLLNEKAESFIWAHEMKTTVYHAFHENSNDYVDAHTNKEGEVDLYHYSPGSKTMIPRQEVNGYFQNNFTENFSSTSVVHEFDVDYLTGNNQESRVMLHVKRTSHAISQNSQTSMWTLNFSLYEASKVESGISSPCLVHHTLNQEDFIKFCENRKTFTFSRSGLKGVSAEDICVGSRIKVGKITLDDPLHNVKGSNKYFYGDCRGMEAVVKRCSLNAGLARKYENIVASNYHDNISRFLGGERVENGDLLLAFQPSHRDFEEICHIFPLDQLVSVMRGVLNGLAHLHQNELCFGNFSPWKVLLSRENVAKLCGTGNCRKLTKGLKDADFREFGRFMAYAVCRKARLALLLRRFEYTEDAYNKLSRFDIPTEDAYNNLRSEDLLEYLKATGEMEIYDMAAYLIQHGSYPVKLILCRPWTWVVSGKVGFFRDIYDFLDVYGDEEEDGGTKLFHYIVRGTTKFSATTSEGSWRDRFPKKIINYMENPPKVDGVRHNLPKANYKRYEVMGLLRFLRNLIAHRAQIYEAVGPIHGECIRDEEALLWHIHAKFPRC